jgi:hypothetical protein
MPLQEAFSHICEVVTPPETALNEMLFHLRNGSIQGRAERPPTSSERQAGKRQTMEMSLGPDFWNNAQLNVIPDSKLGGHLILISPKLTNSQLVSASR